MESTLRISSVFNPIAIGINEGMSAQPSPPEPERKALALTGTWDQKIGVPRLAILYDKPHGQGAAEISNAASGVRMGTMFFVSPSWAVRDIASQDLDADGSSELSVLVEADDGSQRRCRSRI